MTAGGADQPSDLDRGPAVSAPRLDDVRTPDAAAGHTRSHGAGNRFGRKFGEPSPWLGNLAELWRQPWAADTVASRDVAAVYRLLQQVGVAQRRIAVLTGQSQSEISEILAGRQVRDIRVVTRIVDALELPRDRFGLAPAPTTAGADDGTGGAEDDHDSDGGRRADGGGLPVRCQCGGRLDVEELPTVSLDEIPESVDQAYRVDGVPTPLIEVVTEEGFRRLTVSLWSGVEIRMLRLARRMSVREFAHHLGVSDRMVSKWEAGGRSIVPRPLSQDTLDTSLNLASLDQRARFAVLWRHTWPTDPIHSDRPTPNGGPTMQPPTTRYPRRHPSAVD